MNKSRSRLQRTGPSALHHRRRNNTAMQPLESRELLSNTPLIMPTGSWIQNTGSAVTTQQLLADQQTNGQWLASGAVELQVQVPTEPWTVDGILFAAGQPIFPSFPASVPQRALVMWGDGSTSLATIDRQIDGSVEILAPHTYTAAGNVVITVQVEHWQTGDGSYPAGNVALVYAAGTNSVDVVTPTFTTATDNASSPPVQPPAASPINRVGPDTQPLPRVVNQSRAALIAQDEPNVLLFTTAAPDPAPAPPVVAAPAAIAARSSITVTLTGSSSKTNPPIPQVLFNLYAGKPAAPALTAGPTAQPVDDPGQFRGELTIKLLSTPAPSAEADSPRNNAFDDAEYPFFPTAAVPQAGQQPVPQPTPQSEPLTRLSTALSHQPESVPPENAPTGNKTQSKSEDHKSRVGASMGSWIGWIGIPAAVLLRYVWRRPQPSNFNRASRAFIATRADVIDF